jgi:hypothetical protein
MEDGGSFEVDGQWQLPPDIPETIVVECRRWLAAHDAASGIAQEGRIKQWLLKLLGGLPGDYSAEVVQMKMGAFVFALSDYRAYCFDDVTLKLAMRKFKFWPSAAELIAFADEMEEWTRRTAARAFKISDAGPCNANRPTNLRPWAEGGEEDCTRWNREQADRERRELAAVVESKYGKPTPAPARFPDESAKDYAHRLRLHMDAELDKVTKQTRGGMRPKPKGADKVPPPSPEAMKAAYDTTGIKPKDVRESQPAEAEGTP